MTSPTDVYYALRGAKMTPANAATLTAIAGAESGWRLDAVGDVGIQTAKWGPSYGLFQIRTLKAETGKGLERDIEFLKKGLYQQAAAAATIWRAQGPRAWSTYTNGSYKRFSAQARKATTPAAAAAGLRPSKGAAATPAPAPSSTPSAGGYVDQGGTSSGGVETVGASNIFPGGALDPLNWAGSLGGAATSSVASAVWGQVQPFLITGMFALGALALIVAGGVVATGPTRQKIQAQGEQAAGAVAKVAMVA